MGLVCNGNLSLKKFKCLGRGMLKFSINWQMCLLNVNFTAPTRISKEKNRPLDSKYCVNEQDCRTLFFDFVVLAYLQFRTI